MEKEIIWRAFEQLVQKVDPDASWYDESIEDEKPVIVTDWYKIADKYPNLQRWLEENDCETGFTDEWDECQVCYRGIYTTPRNYGHEPNWVLEEYGLTCQDCWLENPQTEEFINCGMNRPKAIYPWMLETFKKMGFQCLGEDDDSCQVFESGWHLGQNDTPAGALEQLLEAFPGFNHEIPGDRLEYLFLINSIGQFDVDWSIWYRINSEED